MCEQEPWIEWSGGECPTADSAAIEIMLRSQQTYVGIAGRLTWAHGSTRFAYEGDDDIVAYRLHIAGEASSGGCTIMNAADENRKAAQPSLGAAFNPGGIRTHETPCEAFPSINGAQSTALPPVHTSGGTVTMQETTTGVNAAPIISNGGDHG